jgi:Activator of Hsp90 ATPase homolog 1-like protein
MRSRNGYRPTGLRERCITWSRRSAAPIGRPFGILPPATVTPGGEYVELIPNERLRYSDRFEDPNMPGEIQVTVTLKKISIGTELSCCVHNRGYPQVGKRPREVYRVKLANNPEANKVAASRMRSPEAAELGQERGLNAPAQGCRSCPSILNFQ